MKKLGLITLLIIFAAIIKTPPAYAACDFASMDPENDGTFAFNTTCAVTAQIIDGIDWAAGSETTTDNTATFNISGGVFTLNPGTSDNITTFVTGTINITGGNISMADTYSQIKINNPKYCTDADADGWAIDFTFSDATASGLRRCSLMHSLTLADCDDADPNTAGGDLTTYYQDLDGDTYGNSSVSESACSPSAGYVENSTDCYDADPATTNAELAYPGSSSCLGSHRGDNSYDYNCSSSDTKCGVIYNHVCYTTPYGHYSCGGMAPDKYCKDQTINLYRSSSTYSCGQTGCIGTGSIVRRRNSCNSNGTTCSFGLGESGYVTVDTGPQTCQ